MSITSEILSTALPLILAAGAASIGLEFLKLKIERSIRERRGETTSERIEKLSRALTDATRLIGGIERELKERHRLVESLREDCDRYEQLAKLKATEVDAVVQSLRGEIRREGKRGFWQAVVLNLVFFLAGAVVTIQLT